MLYRQAPLWMPLGYFDFRFRCCCLCHHGCSVSVRIFHCRAKFREWIVCKALCRLIRVKTNPPKTKTRRTKIKHNNDTATTTRPLQLQKRHGDFRGFQVGKEKRKVVIFQKAQTQETKIGQSKPQTTKGRVVRRTIQDHPQTGASIERHRSFDIHLE